MEEINPKEDRDQIDQIEPELCPEAGPGDSRRLPLCPTLRRLFRCRVALFGVCHFWPPLHPNRLFGTIFCERVNKKRYQEKEGPTRYRLGHSGRSAVASRYDPGDRCLGCSAARQTRARPGYPPSGCAWPCWREPDERQAQEGIVPVAAATERSSCSAWGALPSARRQQLTGVSLSISTYRRWLRSFLADS